MDEKQEIQSLRRELEQANYEYYVLDNPSMSDYDFDHKLRRLEELEVKYPELVTPDSSGCLVRRRVERLRPACTGYPD